MDVESTRLNVYEVTIRILSWTFVENLMADDTELNADAVMYNGLWPYIS
jgi:hypothetical protein